MSPSRDCSSGAFPERTTGLAGCWTGTRRIAFHGLEGLQPVRFFFACRHRRSSVRPRDLRALRSRMKLLPDWIKNGYLRLVDPAANWMVRKGVHPNTITVFGTLCTAAGGVIYATGHIRTGGWFLGLTALFDVLDGTVARRTNRSSTFGAFLDSTLDRLSDGFVLGGRAVVYATSTLHHSIPLMITAMLGIIGSFLTSYTRARAESLGLDAKVGLLQRPERVVLLSAPQALFGL